MGSLELQPVLRTSVFAVFHLNGIISLMGGTTLPRKGLWASLDSPDRSVWAGELWLMLEVCLRLHWLALKYLPPTPNYPFSTI